MAYDDSRLPAEAAPHILLEGREQLTVSGVEEVESFDENTIVMSTVKGTLVGPGRGPAHREALPGRGRHEGWRAAWTPSPMRTTAAGGAGCSPACWGMTVDVAAQGAALVQAVLLGLGAGALYDLFRILRVRVRLPLLGPALDLLFWLTLTVTLFLWSQWAWGGPVRLYGRRFCFWAGWSIFGF